MAASYAITLTRGEDLSLNATWLIDDLPVDLSDASAVFWVDGQPGPLLSSPVTLGGEAGTLNVLIASAALSGAMLGAGGGIRYRLLVTVSGVTTALLSGTLVVAP